MQGNRSALLAAMALAAMLPNTLPIVRMPDDNQPITPRKSRPKAKTRKGFKNHGCTPWKDILIGKVQGIDYGKRECERRMRQMARAARHG